MASSNLDTNTVLAKAFGFLNSVAALTVFVGGSLAILLNVALFSRVVGLEDVQLPAIGAAISIFALFVLVAFFFGFSATVISIGNELRAIKSLLEKQLQEQSELTKVFKDTERATSTDESFSALE